MLSGHAMFGGQQSFHEEYLEIKKEYISACQELDLNMVGSLRSF